VESDAHAIGTFLKLNYLKILVVHQTATKKYLTTTIRYSKAIGHTFITYSYLLQFIGGPHMI
jgi:hypothetical protein